MPGVSLELRDRVRDERQELLQLRAEAGVLRAENESLRRQVVRLGASLGDALAQVAARRVQVQRLADRRTRERQREESQGGHLTTVRLLAEAAEAKDAYTHGHCETVSRYARRVAERLQMDAQEVHVTCRAALLHDIGKIAVSDGILHKPGPLLPEERELMRSHVRVGYDLLRTVPALEQVADIVLHHHEWWDGTGYPTGLCGEAIPRPARIVSVVDAYCAMVDRRSYKEPLTDADARVELHRCAGTQFEPAVVEAFCSLLDDPTLQDANDDLDAECGLPPMPRSSLPVREM